MTYKDRLFDLTFAQFFFERGLSELDIDIILDIFLYNPDITPIEFKTHIFNEFPELYNKLLKLHLIY